jgi:hypothetical protein
MIGAPFTVFFRGPRSSKNPVVGCSIGIVDHKLALVPTCSKPFKFTKPRI